MSDQQVNVVFVREVEKHPVLYNFTLPGYSRKEETEKAWHEVGKAVNMTVAESKERWKNLHAVFSRNMKPSKSGSGAKAKKAYYLSELMKFTLPYIKALGTPSGNLPRSPQEEEPVTFEDDTLPENTQELQSTPPLLSTQIAETEPLVEPSTSHKRKRPSKNDAVDKAIIDFLNAQKAKTSTTTDLANQCPRTEGIKMFLLSMLPDLVTMTNEELRQFKRKALDSVEEIFSLRTIDQPEIVFLSEPTTPDGTLDSDTSPSAEYILYNN